MRTASLQRNLACFSHHLRKVVREAPAGQRLGKALGPAAADGTSLQGDPEVKRKALLLRPFGRISHRVGEKCGLGLLGVTVFLLAAAVQIRTMVTGQDPDSYLYLARQLAENPVGSPAWRGALLYVAPGYPLLLAAVRKAFGPFAGIWTNLPFAVLLFAAMNGLVRRLSCTEREQTIVVLGAAALLFLGRPENTWFLLYPFRETPSCALALSAFWWLMARPPSAARPAPALGAGLLLLAATGIREPMLLLWVGAALWILTETRAASARPLLFLFAPLLAAALLLAGIWASGVQPSQQWIRILARFNVSAETSLLSAVVPRFLQSSRMHVGLMLQQATWPGVLLLLLGLWRMRRDRVAWCFFVCPALLLFVFYGFFPAHRRYMLSMLVFLAPLAGAGLATLLGWAAQGAEKLTRRRMQSGVLAAGALALVLALLAHASRMTPWGPRVTRGDVRGLLAACEEFAGPGDAFQTEKACRWINNALAAYGPFRVDVDPATFSTHWAAGRRAFFLKPLDAAAFFAPAAPLYPVHELGRLQHRMNALPMRTLQYAGAAYEVLQLKPWSDRRVQDRVRFRSDAPAVVWVDLQAAEAGAAKAFRALDSEGVELGRWRLPRGHGLLGLWFPTGITSRTSVLLEAESSVVLPDPFVVAVADASHPARFDMTFARPLSVQDWFELPGAIGAPLGRYAVAFDRSARFLPPPVLGEAREMEVLFILSAAEGAGGEAAVSNWRGETELSRHAIDWSRNRHYNSFVVPVEGSGNTPPVRMQLDAPASSAPQLRLHEVRIWVR